MTEGRQNSDTSQGHYPRPRPKGFRGWHFGKLGMVWGGAVALLVFLMLRVPDDERHYYLGIWLILMLPLIIITWIWWSERERR
jgi:hypothetical protein